MGIFNIFKDEKIYFRDCEAIIFDMDGTFIDSMSDWCSESLWALKSYDERREEMTKRYDEGIVPKEHALELFGRLKKEGIPFCVATNTPYEMAEKMLGKYGFDELYNFYIDCETVGKSKPEPDMFFEAARRLGFPPGRTVVFEDSYENAKAAKNAGFIVVGMYDFTARNNMEKMQKMCDDYIFNFSELLK